MRQTFALANARVVLPEEVANVPVLIRDGLIHRLGSLGADVPTLDCAGDVLVPGLVELHTDNLERHLRPRPGTRSSAAHAICAHDAELAAAGITTALDAISLGTEIGDQAERGSYAEEIAATVLAMAEGLLRVDHHLHFRCELSSSRLPEHLKHAQELATPRLVSLMDHTPGQGQWSDIGRFRKHYKARHDLSETQLDELVEHRQRSQLEHAPVNRTLSLAFALRYNCAIASHDDTTRTDIERGRADGCSLAEFPTSLEAALAAREHGMRVIAGAPNLARGGSHSGNVSAADLFRAGACDILSSDYYPPSLLQAAFILTQDFGRSLPEAIRFVATTPAQTLGFSDRGAIAEGKRADLVRVRATPRGPVVIAAWSAGRQVA